MNFEMFDIVEELNVIMRGDGNVSGVELDLEKFLEFSFKLGRVIKNM